MNMVLKGLKAFQGSSLFKTATVYGGLNVLRQAIPFFLLPVITHYLSPADYGVLAMFNILVSFIYVFINLGLDAAIGREYFERDTIDFPNYVLHCLGSGIVCAAALMPLIYFLGPWSENITGVPVILLWVVLAVGFCRYVTQILLVIWQSGSRAFSYSALQIGQTLADAGLTLFFILSLGMGLDGRIGGIFYAALLFAGISLVLLWRGRWLKFGFNRTYLRMAYGLGVPLIPHALGAIAISMADRVFLMNMEGPTKTGYYFIGFQIGGVLSMAVWAFNQAWNPWLFQKLKDGGEDARKNIVQFTYFYFGLALLAALFITLIAPLIFEYFISKDYEPGIPVVAWAAFSSAFMGMYFIVSGYIIYARKTHILSVITLSVGTINIGISYILIWMNGYIGAAQGMLIANFLLFVMTWGLSAKVQPMPWLPKKFYRMR